MLLNPLCQPWCLYQEVDRIIAQMMRAADYLGWDVTELRPVWNILHFIMLLSNQCMNLCKSFYKYFLTHYKEKWKVFLKRRLFWLEEWASQYYCVYFCCLTGSQRNDDGHRRGQQWHGHSGGMAEGRHEQHPLTCAAWTEGDRGNTPLAVKGPVCFREVLEEALLAMCFTSSVSLAEPPKEIHKVIRLSVFQMVGKVAADDLSVRLIRLDSTLLSLHMSKAQSNEMQHLWGSFLKPN